MRVGHHHHIRRAHRSRLTHRLRHSRQIQQSHRQIRLMELVAVEVWSHRRPRLKCWHIIIIITRLAKTTPRSHPTPPRPRPRPTTTRPILFTAINRRSPLTHLIIIFTILVIITFYSRPKFVFIQF